MIERRVEEYQPREFVLTPEQRTAARAIRTIEARRLFVIEQQAAAVAYWAELDLVSSG